MIKYGNFKIGDDTIILNMGTASDCPSKKLGLCPIYSEENKGKKLKCYALKPEILYRENCTNYRNKQREFWEKSTATEIANYIKTRVNRRTKETKFLRFNEASDFHTQQDVRKLSSVANQLKDIGITTYGFTARKDLNFNNVNFIFKGSGHDIPNSTGKTKIITDIKEKPKGKEWVYCPGNCRVCGICSSIHKINVAFIKH